MLSSDQRADLREIEAAATPGPWSHAHGDTIGVGIEPVDSSGFTFKQIIGRLDDLDYDEYLDDDGELRERSEDENAELRAADTELIVQARNHFPALLDLAGRAADYQLLHRAICDPGKFAPRHAPEDGSDDTIWPWITRAVLAALAGKEPS